MTELLEQTCLSTYAAAAEIYATLAPAMGSRAFGFKILYGPPKAAAPVLFLGLQPGGSALDATVGAAEGERTGWPDRIEYAYKSWRLAAQMRKVWSPDFLDQCVGLNAIFFRAPSWADWNLVPLSVRHAAEAFCAPRVRELIVGLNPQQIVVIGTDNFKKLNSGKAGHIVVQGGKGRPLVQAGELFGVPAYATIHLSAQISNADMATIQHHFAGRSIA